MPLAFSRVTTEMHRGDHVPQVPSVVLCIRAKNTKSAHTQLQNTKLSVTFRINGEAVQATIALPLPRFHVFTFVRLSRSFL